MARCFEPDPATCPAIAGYYFSVFPVQWCCPPPINPCSCPTPLLAVPLAAAALKLAARTEQPLASGRWQVWGSCFPGLPTSCLLSQLALAQACPPGCRLVPSANGCTARPALLSSAPLPLAGACAFLQGPLPRRPACTAASPSGPGWRHAGTLRPSAVVACAPGPWAALAVGRPLRAAAATRSPTLLRLGAGLPDVPGSRLF